MIAERPQRVANKLIDLLHFGGALVCSCDAVGGELRASSSSSAAAVDADVDGSVGRGAGDFVSTTGTSISLSATRLRMATSVISRLSPQESARVEDYLNDKIQTAADLESLDSLLANLRAQQELQRKQVRTARYLSNLQIRLNTDSKLQ